MSTTPSDYSRTIHALCVLLRSQLSVMQEIQDYLKTISPNLHIVQGDFDTTKYPDEQVKLVLDIYLQRYSWRQGSFIHEEF